MVCLKNEIVQALENLVGFGIVVPTISPALDHSSIVAIDENVAICCRNGVEGVEKKLSLYGFLFWV